MNNQSEDIRNSIQNSFNYLISNLNSELSGQKEFKNLPNNFNQLKHHFIALNAIISTKLNTFSTNRYQEAYKKKLAFTRKLDNQTSKLLALLIVKKLNRIVETKDFYLKSLNLPILHCTYKISLREYFEFV